MGDFSFRREKMKVLSAIVAAATASVTTEWPGVSVDNSCGSLWEAEESIVNKTCTISAPNAQYQFAGNGAFVTGADTFTGFDGVSGSVNVVVFYNQAEDADGNLDNSTCWTSMSPVSTTVPPPPVSSSWRTSTTTATPRTVTITSRSLVSRTARPSPSS